MWNRIIITDKNRGIYGALVQEQLRQRRVLFHDKLGWDIPRSEVIEQDQYDRPETVYVILERGGKVEAYARLMPTEASVRYGPVEFSYLTRDATLGLLEGIPAQILGGKIGPQAPDIWEASRVEAAGRGALAALFEAIDVFLREQGVHQMITFTRANFDRIGRHLGYASKRIGVPVSYGGKPYCAIRVDFAPEREDTADVRLAG